MKKVEDRKFVIPEKKIKSPMDIKSWEKSEAYATLLGFVLHLNEAVKRQSLSCSCHRSENTERLLIILDTLNSWITDIPPLEQPQRFGNKAFRDWHNKLETECTELLTRLLPEDKLSALGELSAYFLESFGNPTRIDYGTGHETTFIMFLCALSMIGVFDKEDSIALVNVVFQRYLKLVRRLQQTYRMEPAGSQGVWSLDDYQFVTFIWGSSQLIHNPSLEPGSFTNASVVEKNANEYMFMDAIKYINEVKTGPFAEHSNQLYNISAVHQWSKVNTGLIKMYKAEVCL